MSATFPALREEAPLLGRAYALDTSRTRPLSPVQLQVRDAILAGDQEADYEAAACPCGAGGPDLVVAQVDRHGLPYRKVICATCGLLRATPRWGPARYSRFYAREYRDLYNPIVSSKEAYARGLIASPWFHQLAAWVQASWTRYGRQSKRAQVVEIGAGGGWNLALLPASWERIGYDVDHDYLALGERLFGCTMRYGFVEEALEALATADLVLLSHVVEHFADPVGTLAQIAGRLAPGALICIEVPGIFRIHRTNLDVMSYMQNAHTFTFCAATLRDICARAGLEILSSDETVRLVCRPQAAGRPTSMLAGDPALSKRIISYLRRCEQGYAIMLGLKRLPIAGTLSAALWRRLYFPRLALTLPRQTRAAGAERSQGPV